MKAPFSSFETRRWVIACALAVLMVALQIGHAARVSGTGDPPAPAPVAGFVTTVSLARVEGTVAAVGEGLLAVRESGSADPVAFPAGADALVTRDGVAVDLPALRAGDAVRMTIDASTGRLLQLEADPSPRGWTDRVTVLGPGAAVFLLLASLLLVARLRGVDRVARFPIRVFAPLRDRLSSGGALSHPNRPCDA